MTTDATGLRGTRRASRPDQDGPDRGPATGPDRPGGPARRSRRRTPATWLRSGGLSTLVFALPLILVFGVFSWWPIVRATVMSFQQTNLVTAPTFVGWDNFAHVLHDPLLPTAIANTVWFAVLALVFGYPLPLVLLTGSQSPHPGMLL